MSDGSRVPGDADAPLSDEEQTRKDMSYSPASETETAAKQHEGERPEPRDPDIDPDDVNVLPGTGGPDDSGDVEVDPADTNLPQDPDITTS